jgi:hypothetical protein
VGADGFAVCTHPKPRLQEPPDKKIRVFSGLEVGAVGRKTKTRVSTGLL